MRPMVKVNLATFFVARTDALLPDDQLESSLSVDLEPLQLHVDQDTLLFIMKFTEPADKKKGALREAAAPFFIRKTARRGRRDSFRKVPAL